ncbi:MAG: hypothetical protein JNL42_05710 [Anaerolineae bacterium]|nr:hypothetical protein [Anaerolineae bacterium]
MPVGPQIDEGRDSGQSTPVTGNSALDSLILALDGARAFNEDVKSAIEDITAAVDEGGRQIIRVRHEAVENIIQERDKAIRMLQAGVRDPLYRPPEEYRPYSGPR